MIKDIFKLKKNSWHLNLMKWIWGYNENNFRNMCPYFWLTIFNVVFLPFIAFLFGIRELFFISISCLDKLFQAYEKRCNERELIWLKEMEIKVKEDIKNNKLNKNLLYNLHMGCNGRDKKYHKLWSRFNYENREVLWEKYMTEEKKEREKKEIIIKPKKEISLEKKKTKEQQIAKLIIVVKHLLKVVLVGVGLIVAYLLFLLIKWMTTFNWIKIGIIALKIIIGLGFLGLVIFVAYTIVISVAQLWCLYGKYCIPCDENRKKIGNFFPMFLLPFKWIWKGLCYVGRGIKLIWEIIVTLKQDNCPGIEWVEEGEET